MSTYEHTVDEWMTLLGTRSLEWLLKQLHPCVRGYNGKEHDAAVDALIERKRKIACGECRGEQSLT